MNTNLSPELNCSICFDAVEDVSDIHGLKTNLVLPDQIGRLHLSCTNCMKTLLINTASNSGINCFICREIVSTDVIKKVFPTLISLINEKTRQHNNAQRQSSNNEIDIIQESSLQSLSDDDDLYSLSESDEDSINFETDRIPLTNFGLFEQPMTHSDISNHFSLISQINQIERMRNQINSSSFSDFFFSNRN